MSGSRGRWREIPCYASAEEMLSRHPEIEAVVIASPNDEHLEQMRLCAERGLHILSMKIPTFDLDEYDAMIEAVDKAGVVCQVELELHYNPVVQRVFSLIESGRLGRPPFDPGNQRHPLPGLGLPLAGLAGKELRTPRPTRAGRCPASAAAPWPTTRMCSI